MSAYWVTPEADADLQSIWEFIANDSVDAADQWDKKLRAAFELLARNPRVGHQRRDLTPSEVLFWPVGTYLIVYRVALLQVEILAVTQGGRDIPRFLAAR